MKNKSLHAYITRLIAALLCTSLISSCAYEAPYGNNYPNHGSDRNTGGSYAPLIIGAAAIGAIALAKRHHDKKEQRHYNNQRFNNQRFDQHQRTNHGHAPYNHSNNQRRRH